VSAPPLVASSVAPLPVRIPAAPYAPSMPTDTATDALMRLAREPIDYGVLPGGLNGARRKKAVAWVVALLLLVVVGSLAVAAIVSQSVKGH